MAHLLRFLDRAEANVSSPRLAAPHTGAVEAHHAPDIQRETAAYIAQMASEMAGLAGRANLGLIAYFLDMARLESLHAAGLAKSERR